LRKLTIAFVACNKNPSLFRLSVSTKPLADKARRYLGFEQVLWLSNAPHISWFERDSDAKLDEPAECRLGYFPGTRSHDRDFGTIQRPLKALLEAYPRVSLNITGTLNAQLNCRAHQLRRFPKVPFEHYWRAVASTDINLAPLEPTEFNRHKSGLKGIEAGFWNRPTIAATIPDIARFQHCGVTLADSEDDWYRQLEQLVSHHQNGIRWQFRDALLSTADARREALKLLSFLGLFKGLP